jgi:ATP-dependent DNA helicase RecG
LVRECINNSLAHRDYTIDRFVNIDIFPQKHIEIRNPGGFKKSLLLEAPDHSIPLRRIIPNQKPVNPKLADILKVFNKYEGKGIGMATLVNECMNDKIDLPYYKFNSENDISLIIPKGKLLDDKIENLLNAFSGFIDDATQGEKLSNEQKHVIAYLYKSEIENENYHYTILLTPDNNHLHAIKSLEKNNLIYKHEKSTSVHPVFLLNRVLMKTNFNPELSDLFGNSFKNLKPEHKDCLKTIYQICTFSKDKFVHNAAQVAYALYYQNYKTLDIKTADSFKRKIRSIFNKLEQGNFIKRENKKYLINTNYQKSCFD